MFAAIEKTIDCLNLYDNRPRPGWTYKIEDYRMGCDITSNAATLSQVPIREILLVDDDPALLDVLPQTIEHHVAQVTVTACDSAETALRHIAARTYDLVITDLNMPGMKGLEFIRRVKALCPHLVVLVISGHGDEAAQEEVFQAGCTGFLKKPFDPNEVIRMIKQGLQHASR
jgi:two-component system C4-dicarboxylate transport response regulator DctD